MGADAPTARPRCCVLDVDGTLLDSNHSVTSAVRNALEGLLSRGIDVVLASSRGPAALRPILAQTGLASNAIFIASQGALLGRFGSSTVLEIHYRRPTPREAARIFTTGALKAGLAVSWFRREEWLVSHVDPTIESEVSVVGVRPMRADLMDGEQDPPDKIMVIAPQDARVALRHLEEALPSGLQAQTSNPGYLEVTAVGVDKGSALREYCAARNIATEATLAVGDGLNDLGLFAVAGISVAMGNAPLEVRQVADHVTSTNDNDGVVHALRRFVR